MKKLLLVGVATLAVSLSVMAQSVVVGGYPIFSGSFQHQGPVPDTLTNATLGGTTTISSNATVGGTLTVTGATTFSGGISTSTNTAALTRVANPLTSGQPYTNSAFQAFLRVNLICTNTEAGYITNISTGDSVLMGNAGNTSTGTNYANAFIRVGPSEIVEFTNLTSTPNLLSSELRN